jgi:hypothetical protein
MSRCEFNEFLARVADKIFNEEEKELSAKICKFMELLSSS